MRPIKFRAWDTEKRQMIYPDAESKEWDYFRLTLQGEICLYDTDDGQKSGLWEHDISYKKDRFVLEQYTGLKDKNGKLIFEGDIVKIHHLTHQFCGMTGKVHYLSASFWITGTLGGTDHWIGEWVEIIGNIHESTIHDKNQELER